MTVLLEWLNLFVRWVHVIAAIMWVGDSFLFVWLDNHLSAPTKQRDGSVVGEVWMTHSGGFYEVIKRKSLAQNEVPGQLHWFKWESYTTWLSGFCLLCIVYYAGGAAFHLWQRVRYHQVMRHAFALGGSACHIVAVLLFVLPRGL